MAAAAMADRDGLVAWLPIRDGRLHALSVAAEARTWSFVMYAPSQKRTGGTVIKLTELLAPRGLTSFDRTKIVRHLDRRMDVKMLRRRGFFDFYQRTQAKDVFNCERIVSFIGDDDGRAIFCGVYGVEGNRKLAAGEPCGMPGGYPYPEWLQGAGVLYELSKAPGFEDIEDRVVIDWGDAPLAWHQWFQDREVVEILPAGYVMEWPGYHEVLLPLADLRAVVASPAANREWYRRLSAVAGVYCILNERTGEQYIGSAYGKDGVWGRWRCYAETSHGGNQRLKERCASVAGYGDELVFSILHTLPSSATKDEVVALESRVKCKLGTRAFGLNAN
jgi:hypothetical protein